MGPVMWGDEDLPDKPSFIWFVISLKMLVLN